MNSLRKVLVVDDGRRAAPDLLSTELAELGLSSVTTSVEAASDVLGVIDQPSAIFLNMPAERSDASRESFCRLADRLRRESRTSGVPVIIWDEAARQAGGISAVLRSEVGAQALSGPEA